MTARSFAPLLPIRTGGSARTSVGYTSVILVAAFWELSRSSEGYAAQPTSRVACGVSNVMQSRSESVSLYSFAVRPHNTIRRIGETSP